MEAAFGEEPVVFGFVAPKRKVPLIVTEVRSGLIKNEVGEGRVLPENAILLDIEHGVETVQNGLCDVIMTVRDECRNGGSGCSFGCA